MNRRKLRGLKSDLASLQSRGGVRPRELEDFARSLGRKLYDRGSHPTWVSTIFSDLPPVSIPNHGGRDLNRFTKNGILDQLEADIERFEAQIAAEGDDVEG